MDAGHNSTSHGWTGRLIVRRGKSASSWKGGCNELSADLGFKGEAAEIPAAQKEWKSSATGRKKEVENISF